RGFLRQAQRLELFGLLVPGRGLLRDDALGDGVGLLRLRRGARSRRLEKLLSCSGHRSLLLTGYSGVHRLRPSGAFFLGAGIRPSRCAFLRASLRARRTASAFSLAFFSEGFS